MFVPEPGAFDRGVYNPNVGHSITILTRALELYRGLKIQMSNALGIAWGILNFSID